MPQPPVDSALNPPNPPRKRRIGIYRFLLLTTLPLLGLLLALCAVIALNLHDIETRANTADTEQLPAIFAGQRALINLESLRRYAVIMFAADDPSMRREAGVNALSMVSEIAFDPSAHFSDHATKTRALIYSLSAARSESDDLDQDLTAAMRRMGLLAARLTARVSGVLPGDEAKRREHLDKLAVFPFRGRDHAEDRLRYREETLAPLLRLCAEQGGEAAQDCADLEAAWKEAVNLWERRDIASRDARSAWRELDYTLRDIGEAASIAEAEASYQAMRRISAESKRGRAAIYAGSFFFLLFFLVYALAIHHYILTPISLASRNFRRLRYGRSPDPTPNVRVRELQDLLSILPSLSNHLNELSIRSGKLEEEKDKYVNLSLVDALTGVNNRRSFDQRLALEHTGAALAILMIDVDMFKNYNDTLGHQAGDSALIAVAHAMKSSLLRSSDQVFRYGGEEFAVILPDASEDSAMAVAARILITIRELNIPHPASVAAPILTVSIGVSTRKAGEVLTDEDLVARADTALYRAKKTGRNRICVYQPHIDG